MYSFTAFHLQSNRLRCLIPVIAVFLFISCDAVDSERDFPISDRDKLARFSDEAFVQANPDYFEAWELALWNEGGLRPEPEGAVMFLEHREAIRNRFAEELPEVNELFTLPWVPGSLIVGADIRHIEDVQDGFFRYSSQLPFDMQPDTIEFLDHEEFSEHFFFLVYFDELLNVEEVARSWRQLTDVRFTDPDYLAVWADTPFDVYPGYVNNDYYYLFYNTTFVTERTTLVKVEPRGLQGWRAELVVSFVPGEQPPSNARNIIRQIRSDFNDRFFDKTSLERVEELHERISLDR